MADRGRRQAAAQHGTQACGEFAWITGFGQVVIGAQFEAEDAVQWLATGGEHQYRQLWVLAAQVLEQVKTAAVGQHDIENHRIRAALGQQAAGTVGVVASADLKAFLAQPAAEQVAQFGVVIDQQQFAHKVLSWTIRAETGVCRGRACRE